jgi:hypothetical protein
VGGILGLVVDLTHPFPSPATGTPGTHEFWVNWITEVVGFEAWVPVHVAGLLWPLLFTFAIIGLYRSFSEKGERSYSSVALIFSTMASTFWIPVGVLDLMTPEIVRTYSDISPELAFATFTNMELFQGWATGLFMFLLTWTSFALVGAAGLKTKAFPRWMAYPAIILGVIAWLLTPAAMFLFGLPVPAALGRGIGLYVAMMVWGIALGVYMIVKMPSTDQAERPQALASRRLLAS